MNPSEDLTRWNRAGLSRFDYIDGNAAVFLERLRRALAARFPGWQPVTARMASLAQRSLSTKTMKSFLSAPLGSLMPMAFMPRMAMREPILIPAQASPWKAFAVWRHSS